MPPINFSRSGRTGPFGKLTAEIPKIRVPDDTKDELERLARAAGITLSEYLRDLLMVHAHGVDVVRALYEERLSAVSRNLDDNGKIAG
ncbi:ribbon-helix-helix protein, CopG family [Thauera aromatica]|uniref:Ribbon-helix-helix protein CopG domain-containing protein n=1 Tax=Thauera aromatica K172 TaxID=44139 RepID=A0A2R4BNZ4_THAAR|nr:ribbon-helix-helix protein, CopG family [Thauera aromatica]AVR89039.1 hypothetical protein Tharo_2136 [Thauera aromatica K172]